MTRTDAKVALPKRVRMPAAASASGTAAAARAPVAVPKAYELTDRAGHRAYLWREQGAWAIEADDLAFRRRILRGVKKPIVSIEDELDEDGVQWAKRVTLQPEDPRYANELLWSWGQVGLDDVEVRVVRRHDRQPVWPRWEATE